MKSLHLPYALHGYGDIRTGSEDHFGDASEPGATTKPQGYREPPMNAIAVTQLWP